MATEHHFRAFVKMDSYSTDPSTTKIVFIVMISVLLFILVYYCCGTFPGNRQEDTDTNPDPTDRRIQNPLGLRQSRTQVSGIGEDGAHDNTAQRTVVTVPLNGMIYYREQHSDIIHQIPVREKPPAYVDLYSPPPPYSIRTVTPSSTNDHIHPPAYEEPFKDWNLTLNNDNRFDNIFNESLARPDSVPQNITEINNEATISLNCRQETHDSEDVNGSHQNVNVCPQNDNVCPQNVNVCPQNVNGYPQNVNVCPQSESVSHSPTSQNVPSINIDDTTPPSVVDTISSGSDSVGHVQSNRRIDSEPMLRAPDSDVYSLMREVTVAENCRRDTEVDMSKSQSSEESS